MQLGPLAQGMRILYECMHIWLRRGLNFLCWHIEANQFEPSMDVFDSRAREPREEEREEQAISQSSPHIDLLTPSSTYLCEICMVPLATFTRVVTREVSPTKQQGGYSNLCLACFSGWSISSRPFYLEPASTNYEYMVVDPINAGEWSALEMIALFECVEKFGIGSWDNVHKEFTERTGAQRCEVELAQKYFGIYRGGDVDFNFREIQSPKRVIDLKQGRVRRPLHFFDKDHSHNEALAWQFDCLLKEHYLINQAHFPVNNQSEYLLGILLEKMTNQPREEPEKKHVRLAERWRRESEGFIAKETTALTILRELYVAACNRQSRGGRRLNISENHPDFIGEHVSDYLELKTLNSVPRMAELVATVEDLRQKREDLKTQQRSNKIRTVTQKGRKKVAAKAKTAGRVTRSSARR